MKKLFVTACLTMLFSAGAWAKGTDPVTVESGSLAFVKGGGTATVTFDYANLNVAGVPLNDFLAQKDEKFCSDWEYVIVPGAEESFAGLCTVRLNKKNFTVYPVSDVQADYQIVLHLTDLDLGNMSGMFNPFSSVKGGGATISGTIEWVDNKAGEVICVVRFNNVKGSSAYSDKDRWSTAYFYLISAMQKIVKKSK